MKKSYEELVRLYEALGEPKSINDESVAGFRSVLKVYLDEFDEFSGVQRLYDRAASTATREFADMLCDLVRSYRDYSNRIAAGWLKDQPKPSLVSDEAQHIAAVARSLRKALDEAVPPVLSGVLSNMKAMYAKYPIVESPKDPIESIQISLVILAGAADHLARIQPATRVKEPRRQSLLSTLRDLFRAHDVQWTSTVDEYGGTSLAVDAVAMALQTTPQAAGKAIQRMDKFDNETG